MTNIIKRILLTAPGKFHIMPVCTAFILLAAGCGNSGNTTDEVIVAKTPVTVTAPERKSMSETLEFPATSSYLRKNIIRSATTGRVESCEVVPGATVTKSQLLFTVKTPEASALQEAQQTDSSLMFKGLVKIFSPDNGVISSVSHQNGDYVQEGDELAVLSDQNSVIFNLEVPFELRRYVDRNRTCLLRLPDSTLIKGILSGRLPEMNAGSQTLNYLVKPSQTGKLPQNLIASAIINKSAKENAQVLPKAAILGNETQTEFWVMEAVNDSTAVKVVVKKGIENFDEVEIIEPQFQSQTRILLTGNYGLPDTAAIIIRK